MLDSFAMLASLNRERGLEKVRSLLRAAEVSAEPLLMNEIHIGEVYSVTAADALAVATAVRMDAVIVTGDPEFDAVSHLVTLDRL